MGNTNDWGSNLPKIENPLKKLGYIKILTGLISLALSVYVLVSITWITKTDMVSGWICLAVGFGLLTYSVREAWSGFYMTFRMPLGRTDPSSLAANSSVVSDQSKCDYSADILSEMLNSRTNHTFREPANWLENMFFTTLKPLYFLPLPFRNLALKASSAIIRTVINLMCYLLALFLCKTGLITGDLDFVLALYTWYLFLAMTGIWKSMRSYDYTSFYNSPDTSSYLTPGKLSASIAIAVLVPVLTTTGFSYFNFYDTAWYQHLSAFINSFSITPWFLAMSFGNIALTLPLLWLLWQRSRSYQVVTEVSELRDNWQQSIHPDELFIAIENKIMANRRFMEVPNRIYLDLNPNLYVDGNNAKGKFEGVTIQETQPAYQKPVNSIVFNVVRFFASVLGHLMKLGIAGIIVYLAYRGAADVRELGGNFQALCDHFLPYVLGILCLWIYSGIPDRATYIIWAEMKFESLLLYFRVSGTFTSSKISTGMSVYDSTRSENELIRSSISPWIIISRIVSTTFLGFGPHRFNNKRYIMEMHKDDAEMDNIVREFKEYMNSRENIAGVAREGDLRNASDILKMNRESVAYNRDRIGNNSGASGDAGLFGGILTDNSQS
ncbi:MAG: hypothetical protein II922_11255 [Succinimonas sp.]|nr:hypothetical protein [Succinimonas sp.]